MSAKSPRGSSFIVITYPKRWRSFAMLRLRVDQCWKPKRVSLLVSETRHSSQGYIWMLVNIRSVLAWFLLRLKIAHEFPVYERAVLVQAIMCVSQMMGVKGAPLHVLKALGVKSRVNCIFPEF